MLDHIATTLYRNNTLLRWHQWTLRKCILHRSGYSMISVIHEYQAKLSEIMIVKTELWKKWMKKLSALTFLFENIFQAVKNRIRVLLESY